MDCVNGVEFSRMLKPEGMPTCLTSPHFSTLSRFQIYVTSFTSKRVGNSHYHGHCQHKTCDGPDFLFLNKS